MGFRGSFVASYCTSKNWSFQIYEHECYIYLKFIIDCNTNVWLKLMIVIKTLNYILIDKTFVLNNVSFNFETCRIQSSWGEHRNLNVQVSVLMEHDELNFNIQFSEHIKLTKKFI